MNISKFNYVFLGLIVFYQVSIYTMFDSIKNWFNIYLNSESALKDQSNIVKFEKLPGDVQKLIFEYVVGISSKDFNLKNLESKNIDQLKVILNKISKLRQINLKIRKIVDSLYEPEVVRVLKGQELLKILDKPGQFLGSFAPSFEDLNKAKILIKGGNINLNVKNKDGYTPLMIIATAVMPYRNETLFWAIRTNEKFVESQKIELAKDENVRKELIKLLIDGGAEVLVKNNNGQSIYDAPTVTFKVSPETQAFINQELKIRENRGNLLFE